MEGLRTDKKGLKWITRKKAIELSGNDKTTLSRHIKSCNARCNKTEFCFTDFENVATLKKKYYAVVAMFKKDSTSLQLSKLSLQLSKLKQESVATASQLRDKTLQLQKQALQLKEKEGKNLQIQKELQGKNKTILDLKNNKKASKDTINTEITKLQRSNKELQQQVEKLQRQKNELETSCNDAKTVATTNGESVQKLQRLNEKLTTDNKELQRLNEKLNVATKELQRQMEDASKVATTEIEKLKSCNAKLRGLKQSRLTKFVLNDSSFIVIALVLIIALLPFTIKAFHHAADQDITFLSLLLAIPICLAWDGGIFIFAARGMKKLALIGSVYQTIFFATHFNVIADIISPELQMICVKFCVVTYSAILVYQFSDLAGKHFKRMQKEAI